MKNRRNDLSAGRPTGHGRPRSGAPIGMVSIGALLPARSTGVLTLLLVLTFLGGCEDYQEGCDYGEWFAAEDYGYEGCRMRDVTCSLYNDSDAYTPTKRQGYEACCNDYFDDQGCP